MSIANELSCDVAAAVLTRRGNHNQVKDQSLTEIVLEFHSTLRRLTGQERQRRRSQFVLIAPPPPNTNAASGN